MPINRDFCFSFAVGRKLTPNATSTQWGGRVGAWDRLLNWLALGFSKATVFDFSSLYLLHPLFRGFSVSPPKIPIPQTSIFKLSTPALSTPSRRVCGWHSRGLPLNGQKNKTTARPRKRPRERIFIPLPVGAGGPRTIVRGKMAKGPARKPSRLVPSDSLKSVSQFHTKSSSILHNGRSLNLLPHRIGVMLVEQVIEAG
jgi:hypothetical protein